jgi:hypothetical protein
MSLYDKTMYDSTLNTISGPAPSPTYTVTSVDNTVSNGAGLYWGMNGTSGSAGQVLTSNGTNTSWITADPSLKGSTLKVKGDADFEGDVTIKGKSLTDMFGKIEERLAILHPNEKLEDKWDELKELGKRYKELEAEIIEKEKMWAILHK